MSNKYNHKITKLSDIFLNKITRSIMAITFNFVSENFGLKPYHYKILLMNKLPSHKYKKGSKKKDYEYEKNDPRFKKIDYEESKLELFKQYLNSDNISNKDISICEKTLFGVTKGCIKSNRSGESNLSRYLNKILVNKFHLLVKEGKAFFITEKGKKEFLRWELSRMIEKCPEKYLEKIEKLVRLELIKIMTKQEHIDFIFDLISPIPEP